MLLPAPFSSFCEQLRSNLHSIDSNRQILKILHFNNAAPATKEVNTDYGPVPLGCTVSYQHGQDQSVSSDIIMVDDAPPYPDFPLPEQPNLYSYALSSQLSDYFDGLKIDRDTA